MLSQEEQRLRTMLQNSQDEINNLRYTVLKAWDILSNGAHRLSNFERVEEAKDILLTIVEQIPPK